MAHSNAFGREAIESRDHLLRQGILRLLAIKDSDIRTLTLEQCRDAVDKGLHAGGAFSAVIPLVSLYYGGFLVPDVANPTRAGQDMFVLSKGHAVAPLAAIYAELGYFGRDVLRGSRSYTSILNGHPGPILPGIHLATGPMGQGLLVAEGFAIAGVSSPRFDCYCVCGDGELQEGTIWEAVMYAGQNHLDNLCVLVDENHGQLDTFDRTAFPMPHLETVFRAFGWNAQTVDGTQYDGVYAALEKFKYGVRDGRPTAIVCRAAKGQGAFSDFLNRHKVVAPDAVIQQELAMQAGQREARVKEFAGFCASLSRNPEGDRVQETLFQVAAQMHLDVRRESPERWTTAGANRAGAAGPSPDARQTHRLRRGATAPAGSEEGIQFRRNRHRGDEGFRPRPESGFHRFGPGLHQRVTGRNRRRGPETRAQRGRGRSQHDGDRGGLRRAGF